MSHGYQDEITAEMTGEAAVDVGRRIAGKYTLVRLLGRGAMGEVWLATHDTLGGEFAIKLVRTSDEPEDETAAGRFQLEAQVSAKLSRRTRHIVSVSDHGEEDGLAYLVMERLEGETLDVRIAREALGVPLTAAIVAQIARALAQAHGEGIFHRDLKPANVFLTRDEDGRLLVKLLDFGIARTQTPFRTRSPFMTGKDMVLGTPSYMSPEQARGLETMDYRCDLWALGVLTFEALAQRIPWDGATIEDIFLSICTFRRLPIAPLRPDLPREVEAFFERAFARDLDARFQTADELADALHQLTTPEEVDAALGPRLHPSSSRRMLVAPGTPASGFATAPLAPAPHAAPPPETIVRSRQRALPAPMILGVLAGLGVVIGGVVLLMRSRGAPPPPVALVEPPSAVAFAAEPSAIPPPESATAPPFPTEPPAPEPPAPEPSAKVVTKPATKPIRTTAAPREPEAARPVEPPPVVPAPAATPPQPAPRPPPAASVTRPPGDQSAVF